MFNGIFIASLVCTVAQIVKDSHTPVIPAENWGNKDLIHKDRMSGISEKEFHRNLVNGKYKVREKYPKPYKNERGQIVIQNCDLWKEDLYKYGALQTKKWAYQGKYNL